MALEGVNRYAELVKAVIDGPFYEAKGTIIPYRHGNTDIRLRTAYPNTQFGLYINEFFSGHVTSDSQGNVVFSRHLNLGENEFLLVNLANGRRLPSWVTVRESAIWHVAYAEVFEGMDDDWQEAKDDLSIETVTINGIEDRFGKNIGVYNDLGQDLDTYRYVVHEMHNAYRNYGGKVRGLETSVAAFTQIPPFGYTRRFWGPNWVLDQSMLDNHRFLERSAYSQYSGAGVPGVVLGTPEADVSGGAPSMALQYNPVTQELRWGTLFTPGLPVKAVDGEMFLPGPVETNPPSILGRAGPFVLNATTRYLYLNWGNGTLTVDLSTIPGYPTPSVAQVVAFVNAAAGLTIFSSYNSKVLFAYGFTKPWVCVEPGPLNAAVEIFGVEPGDIVFAPTGTLAGVTFRNIMGAIRVDTDSTLEYYYDGTVTPPVQRLRWGSPGGTWAPGLGWVTITEDGTYTLTDALGHTLTVHVFLDDLPTYGSSTVSFIYAFSTNYSKKAHQLSSTKGTWVTVDTSALPAVVTAGLVDIFDDTSVGDPETPDAWYLTGWGAGATSRIEPSRVIRGRTHPLAPCPAFRYVYRDAAGDYVNFRGRALQYPAPMVERGGLSPQKNSGLLYDYEGFKAKFSAWILSHNATAVQAVLSFSFDGGATWRSGTLTPVATDAGGTGIEKATYVEVEQIIPAGLIPNEVLVSVEMAQATPGMEVSVDDPRIDIEYITSRALGEVTVPRYRHRQFFGELVFSWSPEELRTTTQKYLGLHFKEASRERVFAGAQIIRLSDDTPAGNGAFEYEYNSVGDLRRFRWTPYGTSWTPGAGWVSIPSDGSYILVAPDGSEIEVDVVYSLLPLPTGSPPAVTTSKTIAITDNTVQQGRTRDIMPAHSSLDIFDVTEFDSNGVPVNVHGSIGEADFSVATLVNLDIVPTTPFRYSFLSPSLLPVKGEQLTFSAGAPYTASLLYESDMDQVAAILFEDGISVPNDLWQFNSSNQIQFINPADYKPSSSYTMNYNPVYQLTTPLLDLGSPYQDYMWLADYLLWNRMEHNVLTREATVPVYFNRETRRAALDRRSNMDQAQASLYFEGPEERREISPANWRFVDPFTVSMDSSQYLEGAQYFLTHQEARMYVQNELTIKFEHRSGVDSSACLAASWVEIERNENVDVTQPAGGHVIHQLRLSVSGVRDLRDFRMHSVLLKGLHLFGPGAYVPGLTNV